MGQIEQGKRNAATEREQGPTIEGPLYRHVVVPFCHN